MIFVSVNSIYFLILEKFKLNFLSKIKRSLFAFKNIELKPISTTLNKDNL